MIDSRAHERLRAARPSRRQFLTGAATLLAGSALAACGTAGEAAWRSTYPPRILPSPQPPGTPTPAPTPRPGELILEQFLALSAVLTGFEAAQLSPAIGRVYLQALSERGDADLSLAQLYERAGFAGDPAPTSVDDLQRAGIFDGGAAQSLADTIIEYWYTGIYGSGDQQQVATYVDSLAWEAVTFAKPRSICGPYPGFWREPAPVIP